jgi:DNA-binding NarL/FixJ family response regulator
MSEFLPLSLVKDKVSYRRKRVYKLAMSGLQQKEIADKIHCSLSTIEKDFRFLRDSKRSEGVV